MNPQKTILNGREYEFITAEVVEVDFNGSDKEKLYTVVCKILSPFGSQAPFDRIQARALDANIKNIPIEGEVVLLTKGPTAYNSAGRSGQEYYYTNPISIQSSVHHNGIPGVTEYLPDTTPNNSQTRTSASDGVPVKTSKKVSVKTTIDTTFPERNDVYPVQPYSGDIIIEGRWGQSIRFGSTVDERRLYPIKPYWKKGLGETGNPILIISNGTNPVKKPANEFILENPNEDDSSIWMTSGQEVRFTPASTAMTSIKSKSVDLFNKNNFAGNQVIISSDRLIFNAKKQEIIAFAKESIGLSSQKAVSIDAGQVVEMESSKISLGVDAVSPVLLGDRTLNWLGKLCDIIDKLIGHITSETHPTGTGPSGIPLNASDFFMVKSDLKALRQKLRELPSNLVFLNENPGGASKRDKDAANERRQNESTRYTSGANEQKGDAPATPDPMFEPQNPEANLS